MLRVFAAGSLRPAFEQLAGASFAYDNARELAARIQAGEPADVFASASPEHPARLHAAGLLGEPVPFATNRLVVAVRAGSDAVDLNTARLVIEVAGVPLGDYTRALFAELGLAPHNVVAQETIVDAVADRVLRGHADAGILYATDVAARPGLRAIEVPSTIRAIYVAGVASDRPEARAFLGALPGHPALRQAGFAAPP